jgi:hypothetical protein
MLLLNEYSKGDSFHVRASIFYVNRSHLGQTFYLT